MSTIMAGFQPTAPAGRAHCDGCYTLITGPHVVAIGRVPEQLRGSDDIELLLCLDCARAPDQDDAVRRAAEGGS